MSVHPQSVHFPIAFLLLAGGIYLYGLLKQQAFYNKMGYLLHVLGVCALALAIFTGRYASGQLAPPLTFEHLLNRHEWLAYLSILLYGLMLVWQYLRASRMNKAEHTAFVCVYLLASALLVYVAFLGGKMVYEYGAGVHAQ
ncbi:MAG: DUF2231 domain-containing protein [Bacteroidetes bacterium]|nr:MAG: DUF2231 domain-containing protein [Bacteroidota bacterium]